MVRMSKAQGRRRLKEAIDKILRVWNARFNDLTKADNNKMLKSLEMIEEVAKKLK